MNRFACVFLAAALCAPTAEAQSITAPEDQVPENRAAGRHLISGQSTLPHGVREQIAPESTAPARPGLLGPSARRAALVERGVTFDLEYLGEAATVASGGNRKGSAYAGQLSLKADIDLGKLAGLDGLSFHTAVVNRHGRNGSFLFLGDTVNSTQEIYGGTDNAALHLAYAFGQASFAGGRLEVAAGRLPASNDFGLSPLYCVYLTTLMCGAHGVIGDPGYTFFPNATWGGRLKYAPSDAFYAVGGVYQVRPDNGGRFGTDWRATGQTGAYLPVELGWTPRFGADRLPGHYKLGYARDTSSYDDLFLDRAGQPFAASGLAPRRRHGRSTHYLMVDQMLMRTGPGPTDGVIALAGVIAYDGRSAPVSQVAFAGLQAKGVIARRPQDTINFVIGRTDISGSLGRTQRIQIGSGAALAGGAFGVQTSEWVYEAGYTIEIAPGLHLTPDIQYVERPGATNANRSALVVGLRMDATF